MWNFSGIKTQFWGRLPVRSPQLLLYSSPHGAQLKVNKPDPDDPRSRSIREILALAIDLECIEVFLSKNKRCAMTSNE